MRKSDIEIALEALRVISQLHPDKPENLPDDFNAFEYSGGNYDDAHSMGYDWGNAWGKYTASNLAQDALNLIFKAS